MLSIPDDRDITHDLVLDKLIEETINDQTCLWNKKVFTTFAEYVHEYKVSDSITIIFKIFYYNNNGIYTFTANMRKTIENKYITLFISNNNRIKELVDAIENSKNLMILN